MELQDAKDKVAETFGKASYLILGFGFQQGFSKFNKVLVSEKWNINKHVPLMLSLLCEPSKHSLGNKTQTRENS